MSSPWADDEPSDQSADGRGTALPGLLRAALVVLIGSTIVIFLSAVASSNAAPNSPQEQIALAVHRLGMFAMLIGFLGVLAAYRLPAVLEHLQTRTSGAASSARRRLLAPDLQFLVAASMLVIVWVWVVAWYATPLLHQLTLWSLLAAAGILANLALIHDGCIRSFAVGTLVTAFFATFSAGRLQQQLMLVVAQNPFSSGMAAGYNWLLKSFAIEVTIVLLAGLVSAFYYAFIARTRENDRQPSASQAG